MQKSTLTDHATRAVDDVVAVYEAIVDRVRQTTPSGAVHDVASRLATAAYTRATAYGDVQRHT